MTAPTPEARAAMIALVAQAYRDGVYALHSHGHVTRCCERASEYAETVVPPVPTQPRRVRIHATERWEVECVKSDQKHPEFKVYTNGGGEVYRSRLNIGQVLASFATGNDMLSSLRILLDLNERPTAPAAPVPVTLRDEELVKLYYAALTINKTARRYEAPANREVVTAMRAALAVAE